MPEAAEGESEYGTLDRLLPPEVLASLYRAGVSIAQLRQHPVGPASRSDMVGALQAAAIYMEKLASALVQWDAEVDGRKAERAHTGGRLDE